MDKNKIQAILGLMTKNLECPICLDLLKNPVSTRCDHQFCRFCISQVLKSKRSVPCPLCNKPITERSLQEREELAAIVKNVCELINAFQEDSGDIFTPPKGPILQHFSPSTPEPLVPRCNIKYAKPTGKKQTLNTYENSKDIVMEKEEESQNDFQGEGLLPRTVRSSKRRSSNLGSAKTRSQAAAKAEKTSINSTGNCSSSSSVTTNNERRYTPSLKNKTHKDGMMRQLPLNIVIAEDYANSAVVSTSVLSCQSIDDSEEYVKDTQSQHNEIDNIHSAKTVQNSSHHDVLDLDCTQRRSTVRWSKKKTINDSKNDELLDCLSAASLGAMKVNIKHAETNNTGAENIEDPVDETIEDPVDETIEDPVDETIENEMNVKVDETIENEITPCIEDEKHKEQTQSYPTDSPFKQVEGQRPHVEHITMPNTVEFPAIVYEESQKYEEQVERSLNNTQESFVVNFYDSQSKDPNRIRAIEKKLVPKRRTSKRLQKIQSSHVISVLTQSSVKTPPIITKTYGKRQHVSRAVKEKIAKDWKKVLTDSRLEKESSFVDNNTENEVVPGFATQSTASQGSAFGFKVLDKKELMNSVSKTQIIAPQLQATEIEKSLKEMINGKHTSDTKSQSEKVPDVGDSIVDVTIIHDVTSDKYNKMNENILRHSLESTENAESKNTLNETPLKYGRGKKMSDDMYNSVDNSFLMNSEPVQGYLPKTSSRNRTFKVCLKAGKGKIEMSLENQKSSDEALGNKIKPLAVNRSLNIANIHVSQSFGEKLVDPYEFRSSQTPKGKRKKKARNRPSTKSNKMKALELTITKETKDKKENTVTFADENNSKDFRTVSLDASVTERNGNTCTDKTVGEYEPVIPNTNELDPVTLFVEEDPVFAHPEASERNNITSFNSTDKHVVKPSKNRPKGSLKSKCKNDKNENHNAKEMQKLIEKISNAEDHDIISSTQEAYSSMEEEEKGTKFEEVRQNIFSISANNLNSRYILDNEIINESEDDHCLIRRSAEDAMPEPTQLNVVETICPAIETVCKNSVNSAKNLNVQEDVTQEKQNPTRLNGNSTTEVVEIALSTEKDRNSVNYEVTVPITQTKSTQNDQNTQFVKHEDLNQSEKSISFAEIMKDAEIEIRKTSDIEEIISTPNTDHFQSSVICIPICSGDLFSALSSPVRNNIHSNKRTPIQLEDVLKNHTENKTTGENKCLEIESNYSNKYGVKEGKVLIPEKIDLNVNSINNIKDNSFIINASPASMAIKIPRNPESMKISETESVNHQPHVQDGKQCHDRQTSQQEKHPRSLNQMGEDVIPKTVDSDKDSNSEKSNNSGRKTRSILGLIKQRKDMHVTVVANSIESQASEIVSNVSLIISDQAAGSVAEKNSNVEIKESLVENIGISCENDVELIENTSKKEYKTLKKDSEKDLIQKSEGMEGDDKESSGTDDLNISVDESQYELVDSGSQNLQGNILKNKRTKQKKASQNISKSKKRIENGKKQQVQKDDTVLENKDETTQSTVQASLDSQYKVSKGVRKESVVPAISESSQHEFIQDGENETEVCKTSQILKVSSDVSQSLLNNSFQPADNNSSDVTAMSTPNSSQHVKKITPDSRKRLFARRSNAPLQKPDLSQNGQNQINKKDFISIDVPNNDIPIESSEESTSSLKRKSLFSSYDNKKNRFSSNSASLRNSSELISQESCLNHVIPGGNISKSANPSTANSASVNFGESSDDEDLVIHRPKRKCFSLDGSPINPNKFSQKSSGDSMSSKNMISKGASKNIVLDSMDHTDSTSNTKNLFNSKNQADDSRLESKDENDVEASVDHMNSIGFNKHENSESVNGYKDNSVTQLSIYASQGKANLSHISKKSKSLTQDKNDLITIAETEEVPVMLISPNIEPITTENAETMPPSVFPSDFHAEDNDSVESALHLPGSLELCDVDEEETTDSTKVKKNSEKIYNKIYEKLCESDEISDDESVRCVMEAIPTTAGDDFVSTIDGLGDDCYADLPRTSSPIMGTDRSVKINAIDIEDDEDEIIVRKRGKKMSTFIESDDEEEASVAGESSAHLNSSSAFSSQSELTTQQKGAIVSDIEKMKKEIEALEAEIAGKTNPTVFGNDGDDNEIVEVEEDEDEFISLPDVDTEKNIIPASDDIENPASGNSQSELFLSPLRYSPPPSSPVQSSPANSPNDKQSQVKSPSIKSPDSLSNSEKEDGCEEEMDVDRIADTPEPELPEEVLLAMEILTKYKTQLKKQNSPHSSKQSPKTTPVSKNQNNSKSYSPLVTKSTPNKVDCSLENIENTLKEITPNRSNTRLTSCESTPLKRVHKYSSKETTPILKSRASPASSSGKAARNSSSVERLAVLPSEESGRTMKNISKSERCYFAATGLGTEQLMNIQKLAAMNDGKFYPRFNQHVTHLIVKPVRAGRRVCERTLKFFQGIANKCWILVYDWIEESLKSEYLISEESYEVTGDTVAGENHNGPMQSRLAKEALFADLTVTCIGDSAEMSKDSMINLLTTCGAIYVKDVETLALSNAGKSLIICCSDTQDSNLSSEDVVKFKICYKYHHLITVSREWVLDSIGMFQLGSLKDYLLTPGRVILPF